jgi:hypothetical protein
MATNYNFGIQIRETTNGGYEGRFGSPGNVTTFAVGSASELDTYLATEAVTTYFTTQQMTDLRTALGIS